MGSFQQESMPFGPFVVELQKLGGSGTQIPNHDRELDNYM